MEWYRSEEPYGNWPASPRKAHRDWTQRALYSAAPAALSMRAHGVRTRGSTRLCVRERAAVAVSLAGPSGSIRRLARGCGCVCVCLCAAVGAARDADARAASRATATGGLGFQRHAAHSLRCGSDTVAVGAARDDRRGDDFRAQLRASSETARHPEAAGAALCPWSDPGSHRSGLSQRSGRPWLQELLRLRADVTQRDRCVWTGRGRACVGRFAAAICACTFSIGQRAFAFPMWAAVR